MKITATKIKRILVDKYEWEMIFLNDSINEDLIKDTMKVINEILVLQGQKQFIK
jgi:asparagine synthetase A